MKRRAHLLALSFVTVLSAACDDRPIKVQAADANAATTPTAALSIPPIASTPPPPPKKKAADCPTGNDVQISDKALEAELRRKTNKDAGALTKDDLRQVKSVNLTSAAVNELDPCVFPALVNMKDLFLGPGDLDDLSPLSTLTQMATLRAAINKVSDIRPIDKLTKMDRLDLGRTQVSDITAIANMTALTELQLDETPVADLGPLRACSKLEKLSIKQTRVKDLSPLKDMKKLRFLYIEGAPVENVNVLDPLVNNGLRIVRTGNK